MVEFKGGKRLATTYRYLCVIEDLAWDEDEIKVTALKCMDSSCKQFAIKESDISFMKFEQIIGIAPVPTNSMKGERMFYKFPIKMNIFESRRYSLYLLNTVSFYFHNTFFLS